MNIAIAEDEQPDIDMISSVLREYAALGKLELSIETFLTGEELLENYRPYVYTAIFMDIYMSGMSGMEAARQILTQDRHAVIVFLTSSDEHMPEAFSLHAFDYIAKPAKKERIFQVLDDILLRRTELDAHPKLTFPTDKNDIILPFTDITVIRTGPHRKVEIIDTDGHSYLTGLTFSEISEMLSGDLRFLLILRGVLVNMEHILMIEGAVCRLDNDLILPVNVKGEKKLEAAWRNFQFDRIRSERSDRRRGK